MYVIKDEKHIFLEKLNRIFMSKRSLPVSDADSDGSGTIIYSGSGLVKNFQKRSDPNYTTKPPVTYCSHKYRKHKILKCLYTASACKGSVTVTM
jgi:hypothetical protein